jgi:polysaccharide export outer membrane protein
MKTAIIGAFLLTAVVCFGQNPRNPVVATDDYSSNKPSNSPTSFGGSDYRIGSDDQLDIDVFEIMELAATPRVSASGTISLKFIGNFTAGGLTPQELERAIEKSLIEMKLINEPHVTVSVREYASQPVSIMGAVRKPDIYQIKGQKTLFTMISQAGGLDLNTAGSMIQVFRGSKGSASQREVITIDIQDFERGNAALDIPIYANDTINVQTAGSVFVLGEVIHPDEFVLRNGINISVLKALTKGGGPSREAKKNASLIIRVHQDGSREEIPVDLDKIAQGKAHDIELMPNDILFVPPNKVKAALNKTLESTIGVVSNRLIYRF